MGIGIRTPGVHSVALQVSESERARDFYVNTLGFEPLMEQDRLLIFAAGSTAVALRGPEADTLTDDTFDPFRVGREELRRGDGRRPDHRT